MAKKWYESKTVIAGGLKVLAGLSLAWADYLLAGGVLTVAGFVTIALRVITKESLELPFKLTT